MMILKKSYFCVTFFIIFIEIKILEASHIDGNTSDIFISYAGHSEVEDPIPKNIPEHNPRYERDKHLVQETAVPSTTELNNAEKDVIFVPNDKPIIRNNDDYLENDALKISDVVDGSLKVGDIIRDEVIVTEAAKRDVLFISGKNKENTATDKKVNKQEDSTKTKERVETKILRIDCINLDCDKTVKSVCGGRMDGKKWVYRLFLNECFFRKVNCGFKYPNNRYKKVPLNKCSNVGAHYKVKPMSPGFQPSALPLTNLKGDTRRSFTSRRSFIMDINGESCSHYCPLTCTEKYEPQCALSSKGELKTFLNHCKLDHHSCSNNIVWRIRPLSECVGGRKADMQQNRGFIAWMQKVGIVDNRGRLVLT